MYRCWKKKLLTKKPTHCYIIELMGNLVHYIFDNIARVFFFGSQECHIEFIVLCMLKCYVILAWNETKLQTLM